MSTALATPRRPSFDFIPAAGSRLRTEQQPAFRSSSLRGNDGFSRAEDDDQDIMELLAFPPPPPRFPSPSRQHPPPSSLVAARSFLPTRSPPRPPLSQTSHSTASATSSSPSLGLSSLDGTAQAPVIEFGVAEGGLESTIYLLSTSTTSLEPTAVSKKDRRRGLVVATSFDALASASPSTPPSRRRASTHDAGASPNNSTQSMSSEGNASPSVSFSTDLSRSDATTTATSIASRASKRPTPSRHVGSCHMRAESAKSTLREMMGNPAPNPPHALPPTLPLFSARPIHPASVDVVRSVWDTDDDSAPSASSKSNKTRKKARMEKARTEKMERKRQKRRRGSENVAVEALPDVESMLDGPRFSLGALLQELTAAQERTLKVRENSSVEDSELTCSLRRMIRSLRRRRRPTLVNLPEHQTWRTSKQEPYWLQHGRVKMATPLMAAVFGASSPELANSTIKSQRLRQSILFQNIWQSTQLSPTPDSETCCARSHLLALALLLLRLLLTLPASPERHLPLTVNIKFHSWWTIPARPRVVAHGLGVTAAEKRTQHESHPGLPASGTLKIWKPFGKLVNRYSLSRRVEECSLCGSDEICAPTTTTATATNRLAPHSNVHLSRLLYLRRLQLQSLPCHSPIDRSLHFPLAHVLRRLLLHFDTLGARTPLRLCPQ